MFRQASLFGSLEPAVDPAFVGAARSALSGASWVEHVPRWLCGGDTVFDDVGAAVELRQRRNVAMYDQRVDEPRLTAWWSADDGRPEPLPLLANVREVLTQRYGRGFDSIGFNLYRDGSDSVAWHADRHANWTIDPVIAIVSIGAARPIKLRRVDGGPSLSWVLGDGDLFVMGGACQHEWQHCIPKLRRPTGPRLSITFRHDARPPVASPGDV